MADPPHAAFVRAELRLIVSSSGGRRSPIATGYKCNCRWPGLGESEYHDAIIYLESVDLLAPGAAALIRLQPVFPDGWGNVKPGVDVEVCEGRRVVGTARVLELFPTPL